MAIVIPFIVLGFRTPICGFGESCKIVYGIMSRSRRAYTKETKRAVSSVLITFLICEDDSDMWVGETRVDAGTGVQTSKPIWSKDLPNFSEDNAMTEALNTTSQDSLNTSMSNYKVQIVF